MKIICITMALAILTVALIPVSSQQPKEYDHWCDVNDDGKIDIKDIAIVAMRYGSQGTAINKTALLLELQSKIEALNGSLLNLESHIFSL